MTEYLWTGESAYCKCGHHITKHVNWEKIRRETTADDPDVCCTGNLNCPCDDRRSMDPQQWIRFIKKHYGVKDDLKSTVEVRQPKYTINRETGFANCIILLICICTLLDR